jgi:hypothetical protein
MMTYFTPIPIEPWLELLNQHGALLESARGPIPSIGWRTHRRWLVGTPRR